MHFSIYDEVSVTWSAGCVPCGSMEEATGIWSFLRNLRPRGDADDKRLERNI